MSEKIGVIGAGSWGTAMACAMARNGHRVALYSRSPEVCGSINKGRVNKKYLPSHALPETVTASTDMGEVCKDAAMLFLASPSLYLIGTVQELMKVPPFCGKAAEYPPIAVLTKGFIPDENGEPKFIIDKVIFIKIG